MYTKPTLQQFGSFRDLTQVGLDANGDGGWIFGPAGDGCNVIPTGSCGSARS